MPSNDSKQERDFEKLVMWASSFSIAVLGACIGSLKQVNPSIELQFSAGTVVGFVGGGVLTALFLRIVLHGDKRRRSIMVFVAAIASVLGYFLFAIKNAARENRGDFIIGTVAALTVLSFLAYVIYRVGKFFESDQPDDRDRE
jgi:hypothetical protein